MNGVRLKEMVSLGTALLKATLRLQNAAKEELCGEKEVIREGLKPGVYETVP